MFRRSFDPRATPRLPVPRLRPGLLASLLLVAGCQTTTGEFPRAELRGEVRTSAGVPVAGVEVEVTVFPGARCEGTPYAQLRAVSRADGAYAATLHEFAEGRLQGCVAVRASGGTGAARSEVVVEIVAERVTELGTITVGAS
jgi:hypothetical protein